MWGHVSLLVFYSKCWENGIELITVRLMGKSCFWTETSHWTMSILDIKFLGEKWYWMTSRWKFFLIFLAKDPRFFQIERGKTTAIVGASGCGKSTAIKLLERFYDPIAGNINDRECLRDFTLRYLRSQISLVGQQPTLFNYSIRENIGYVLEKITEDEIIAAAKQAHAHEFIIKMPEVKNTRIILVRFKSSGIRYCSWWAR